METVENIKKDDRHNKNSSKLKECSGYQSDVVRNDAQNMEQQSGGEEVKGANIEELIVDKNKAESYRDDPTTTTPVQNNEIKTLKKDNKEKFESDKKSTNKKENAESDKQSIAPKGPRNREQKSSQVQSKLIKEMTETPSASTTQLLGKVVSGPQRMFHESDTGAISTTTRDNGGSSHSSEQLEVPAAVTAINSRSAETKAPATTMLPQAVSPSVPVQSRPIDVVANGTMPKSGKPLLSTINKKLNKASRSTKSRKPKPIVALYESEISDNKIGIKLCIKKSDASSLQSSGPILKSAVASHSKTAAELTAKNRKRSRKNKSRAYEESDDSDRETKRKKDRAGNNNSSGSNNNGGEAKKKSVSFSANVSGSGATGDESRKPKEIPDQSEWAVRLPVEILCKIFEYLIDTEGCLPTLVRLGRVCSLWRDASLVPKLWKSLDLSTWIKEKHRSELKLKWFVDNRCMACTDLNVANWKMSDIDCFLHKLAVGCPNLEGITLTGWKGFTCDHLAFLVENMKKLERLDLSSINDELNPSKTAVNLQSLTNACKAMNGRLTHLYLAHNRLPGIPQIVNSLATFCPNLVLLDLSNVFTQAASHAVLHVEKLQRGCQKLRVLRITNSRMSLGTATMQEMMDSTGFPDLEELSIAALSGDEYRHIGDEHLQRILKTSSKLKLLDVRGCMRLTHESLIRLPAWDIKHLFLSGCSVTRDLGSRLELIASKWAHSLIELDLAWTNVQQPLDNALKVIAEKGEESPLMHLNLCGSSVSEDAVKEILANCAHMSSINLSSCRGLPRGVKRLIQGPQELQELRETLKVEMKVKLPTQIKKEESQPSDDKQTEVSTATSSSSCGDADGGGGGGENNG